SSPFGGAPVLQLAPVDQLPPAVFVHESVQPAARAEETDRPPSAVSATTVASMPRSFHGESASPGIVELLPRPLGSGASLPAHFPYLRQAGYQPRPAVVKLRASSPAEDRPWRARVASGAPLRASRARWRSAPPARGPPRRACRRCCAGACAPCSSRASARA